MHDADNHGVETIDAVEQKVIAHDKRPCVWRDLGACWAKLGVTGQALASGDDPVDEAVRGCGVVQRHMQPDFIKVSLGPRRIDNAAHALETGGFVRRQTLTSATFDILGIQRLALAAVISVSPEPP